MRATRVWKQLIGVDDCTVIEDIEFEDDDEVVVVHVRPRWAKRRRCGRCEQPASGFDQGDGRRRWRGLDLGTVKVVLEADAPRVNCSEHGVTVAAVPWARHGAGFTRDFEDQAAWLANAGVLLGDPSVDAGGVGDGGADHRSGGRRPRRRRGPV